MRAGPRVLPLVGVLAAPGIIPADVAASCRGVLLEPDIVTTPRPFAFSDYYQEEMGEGLIRFWLGGRRLVSAGSLADLKLAAVALEERWRRRPGGRRVNLDPGYISPFRLVLATTKPLPPAIYLRDGIFAVAELAYRGGAFEPLPWTYPDYRAAAAAGDFAPFRARLLELTRASRDGD